MGVINLLLLLPVLCVSSVNFDVSSPNGKVSWSASLEDGAVVYSVTVEGTPVILASKIRSPDFSKLSFVEEQDRTEDNTWTPAFGQHSQIRDHHKQKTIQLKTRNGLRVDLVVQAHDDGIAFRYIFPKQASLKGKKLYHITEFNFAGDYRAWFPNGEYPPIDLPLSEFPSRQKLPEEDGLRNRMPTVIDTGKGLFGCVLESDIYSAAKLGSTVQAIKMIASKSSANGLEAPQWHIPAGDEFMTPWRVVMFAKSVGELSLLNLPLNLAAPNKLSNTKIWQRAMGFSLMDYRLFGAKYGPIKYNRSTVSWKHQADFAARHRPGIPNMILDGGWYMVGKDRKLVVSDKHRIGNATELMSYAKKLGVGVVLYYDRKTGYEEGVAPVDNEYVFKLYRDMGAIGVKYGYASKDPVEIAKLTELAAEYELAIDIHDNPVPMIGIERTLPNGMTREFCWAQGDRRAQYGPNTFVRMAQLNLIAGPMDQHNGHFELDALQDPKARYFLNGGVNSTLVGEAARILLTNRGGWNTLPDTNEAYEMYPELLQFVAQMPCTWDQSVHVASEIGKFQSLARRSGSVWFVGSATNQDPRELELDLDFLGDGKHTAVLFSDAYDTDAWHNREGYTKETVDVDRHSKLKIRMSAGGGNSVLISPKSQ